MSKHVGWRYVEDFFLGGLATYGALWLGIGSFSQFFPSLKPEGLVWYCTLLGVAAIGGIWCAWPTKQIEFQIPASDSSFEIRFGNVFGGEGVVVIPVNEYFDGELGDHVSENSLHGQFIRDVLGGQSQTFFDLICGALAGVVPEETSVARPSGQCNRYSIGTAAHVDVNDQRYLLVALSHTDRASLKAFATVSDLWTCLAGAWKGIREYSNGRSVRIPLIGSGLSGIGLPLGNLIEIMVTSFLCHTKEKKVADRVALVLPHHLRRKLDLNSIKKNIKRNWT